MKPFHIYIFAFPRTGGILAFFMFLAVYSPFSVQAKISANHRAGSVIIGPDDSPCDDERRGAIRYEPAGDHHEYCDGAQWKKFVTASGAGILLHPRRIRAIWS